MFLPKRQAISTLKKAPNGCFFVHKKLYFTKNTVKGVVFMQKEIIGGLSAIKNLDENHVHYKTKKERVR